MTQPLALVTGAAHRLGKAFALALARRGFAVGLHYHATPPGAAIQAAHELGAAAYPLQADLTDPAQIERLFADIAALPHPLAVLVNSAAVMSRADIRTITPDEWSAVMDLNLRAPLICSQRAARLMDSGLIVNLSDVGAHKAWSGYPAYVVSKAALEVQTRLLARALAPKIRVNAIAPGLVLPNLPPEEWDRLTGRIPLRRAAELAEITSALEFLLDNPYVTAQTLTIDGGYSLI